MVDAPFFIVYRIGVEFSDVKLVPNEKVDNRKAPLERDDRWLNDDEAHEPPNEISKIKIFNNVQKNAKIESRFAIYIPSKDFLKQFSLMMIGG